MTARLLDRRRGASVAMDRGAARLRTMLRAGAAATALGAALVAGCSSGPPVPSWQLDARSAAQAAVQATLSGDAKAAGRALDRARADVARTGRRDLMARLELMACAARVAALDTTPCAGFDAYREDAAEAERAYADYLNGQARADQIERLPEAQREAARAADPALGAVLAGVEDPLSRLIAAGVRMRQGRASPAVIDLAVDTASAQGWRRPLVAWLQAAAARAEHLGDAAEAARLRRRIDLVLTGR